MPPEPRLVAFQAYCDALPKNPQDLFSGRGQRLLAVISNLMQQGSYPCRVDIVTTIVQASKIRTSTLSYRIGLLHMAGGMLGGHGYLQLHAEIVHQRSILMRLQGNVKGSEHIIEDFLSNLPNSQAAQRDVTGPLYLSQAINHSYSFLFSKAHCEAKRYTIACEHSISDKQTGLLWEQIFCVGRVMRGEGRFTEARTCFETCLRTVGFREARRFSIISAVADLYCELDYYYAKTPGSLLFRAKDILVPEIQRLKVRGNTSRGYRRMLLSLIEVEIRLGYDDEGRCLVEEVLRIYNALDERDIVDKLGHVRALMASARVSANLEEEERCWTSALHWNRAYNPLEEEVFTCGVIYLFTGLARYRQGNVDGSRESLARALQVLTKQRRQFLIPGIGTYMFDHICGTIPIETGWSVEIGNHY